MVRRALLERGDALSAQDVAHDAADDEPLPSLQPHSDRPGPASSPWRGAGGRWFVWVGRAVVWAVILLVGYRGVLAIFDGSGRAAPAAAPTATAPPSTGFPVTSAEAYALEFAGVYLDFSPADASARSRDLAAFGVPAADPQLGWNGSGSQHADEVQVADVSVTGTHTAVVTVLARLSTGGLIELGVPVYAAPGGMSLSGNPALLPGPAIAAQPTASQQTSDQATAGALRAQLPAFFEAYASGDQTTLARFAASGAHISGLDGAVTFGAIDGVYVPAGGSTRNATVTVTWQLPSGPATSKNHSTSRNHGVAAAPAALQMTYQLTVVRQGSSWDIQSIGASTRAPVEGAP